MILAADWMTGEMVSVPSRHRDTSHFQESKLALWCTHLPSIIYQWLCLWGWIGQSMSLAAQLHITTRLRMHGVLIFFCVCLVPGQYCLLPSFGGTWCLHLHGRCLYILMMEGLVSFRKFVPTSPQSVTSQEKPPFIFTTVVIMFLTSYLFQLRHLVHCSLVNVVWMGYSMKVCMSVLAHACFPFMEH